MKTLRRLFRNSKRPLRNLSKMSASKQGEPREMKSLSDQELMRIVQAGDFSPASEIYDRYSTRIYNFTYRFLRNSEAAEDATQEVFVKMLKHANQFNGEAKLSTWLFSIAANWCRDYLRKGDNKPKDSDEVLVTLPAAASESPLHRLEQRENQVRIQKALAILTPDQREAILLSRYQGLSYAEIAQISGCSEGAVKTRVFRAMETLKKTLAGEGSGGERCLTAL